MEKPLEGFLRQCPPYLLVRTVQYIFVEFTWEYAACFLCIAAWGMKAEPSLAQKNSNSDDDGSLSCSTLVYILWFHMFACLGLICTRKSFQGCFYMPGRARKDLSKFALFWLLLSVFNPVFNHTWFKQPHFFFVENIQYILIKISTVCVVNLTFGLILA